MSRELSAAERVAFDAANATAPTDNDLVYAKHMFAAGRDCALKWAVQTCQDFAATLDVESNRMAAWKCGYLIEGRDK